MPIWQMSLIALLGAWMLQAFGTYVQMRHYRSVMGEIAASWPDGFVGTGNARARLSAGVILFLVVSPDRIVRRLLIMRGRSVLARFKRVPAFEGRALAEVGQDPLFRDKIHGGALAVAVKQIEKAAGNAVMA